MQTLNLQTTITEGVAMYDLANNFVFLSYCAKFAQYAKLWPLVIIKLNKCGC